MSIDKTKLLELYPEFDTVGDPTINKDGRSRIMLRRHPRENEPGKNKLMSYPRALMEVELGYRLSPSEHVDHYDQDKYNNTIENLNVRNRTEHAKADVIRIKVEPVQCPICEAKFVPSIDQRNLGFKGRSQKPAGPFCSKKCSGTYGRQVQLGAEVLQRSEIKKEYYTLKEEELKQNTT